MAVQCPKERELKGEGGRAFTKQTPDQRFRQTSMEYNIAHQIFPYVPEQSMISGEISNTLKMLSHIKEMQKGNAVMVCLDLKKWCNFQRSSTTIFCSQMLDDLFGTKGLYTNSHNYFVSCNILVNNRLCSPDYEFVNGRYIPLPGPYYTNRNRGGLEGLQQKKWTMIAASVIKYVIEQFNANAISMGQGDNQIIILSLTKENTPEAKKKLIDDFLDKLSTTFKEINSAATKYIECLCAMDFNFNLFKKEPSFGSTIYSIAEGSGGTLATMGTLFPGFMLAYNTLLYPNIDNRDNITFKDPPSFMNNPSLFARLIDDQYRLTQGNTDITSTEWILEFDKVLGNYSPAIVTMDAESMEHGNNLNFVEALFPILAKHKPSIILFKVFLEHESVLERMTCIAEELFGNIHY